MIPDHTEADKATILRLQELPLERAAVECKRLLEDPATSYAVSLFVAGYWAALLRTARGFLRLGPQPAAGVTESGPPRFCEGCQTELGTERRGEDWVLPQHGHPERERLCPGSGTPGVAP